MFDELQHANLDDTTDIAYYVIKCLKTGSIHNNVSKKNRKQANVIMKRIYALNSKPTKEDIDEYTNQLYDIMKSKMSQYNDSNKYVNILEDIEKDNLYRSDTRVCVARKVGRGRMSILNPSLARVPGMKSKKGRYHHRHYKGTQNSPVVKESK